MREVLGTLYTWGHVICIQNCFKGQNSCISNEKRHLKKGSFITIEQQGNTGMKRV